MHRKQGMRAHNIVQDFGSVCAGRIIFKVKGESRNELFLSAVCLAGFLFSTWSPIPDLWPLPFGRYHNLN